MHPAITKTSGPCVILAGAGTGKTTAIVEKLKHIVKNNIYPPEKIVCITFSNEAANNLLVRVHKAIALQKNKEPIIRTFHAFSADLLRAHGTRIGVPPKFKILDPEQAMVILHRNLKVHARLCSNYIGTIGTLKDLGIELSALKEYVADALKLYEGVDVEKKLEEANVELHILHTRHEPGKKNSLVDEIKKLETIVNRKKFARVWSAYEKMKHKGDYLDYADLNARALDLLEQCPDIASTFEYIVVDEFQDTNKLQLDFLMRLAPQ